MSLIKKSLSIILTAICFSLHSSTLDIVGRDTLVPRNNQLSRHLELQRELWNSVERTLSRSVQQVPDTYIALLTTTAEKELGLYNKLHEYYPALRMQALTGNTQAQALLTDLLTEYIVSSVAKRILSALTLKKHLYARLSPESILFFGLLKPICDFNQHAQRVLGQFDNLTFELKVFINALPSFQKLSATIDHELTHVEQRIEALALMNIVQKALQNNIITRPLLPTYLLPRIPLSVSQKSLGDVIAWWITATPDYSAPFGIISGYEYEAEQGSFIYSPDTADYLWSLKQTILRRTFVSHDNTFMVSQRVPSYAIAYPLPEDRLAIIQQELLPHIKHAQAFSTIRDLLYQFAQRSFATGSYGNRTDGFVAVPITPHLRQSIPQDSFSPQDSLIGLIPSRGFVRDRLFVALISIIPVREPIAAQPLAVYNQELDALIIADKALPFIKRFTEQAARN